MPSGQMIQYRPSRFGAGRMVRYAKYARGVSPVHAVASAAVEHIVRQGLRNTIYANTRGHSKMQPLRQTMAVPRGVSRPASYQKQGSQRVRGQHRAGRKPQAKIARKKANSHNRHETLPNRLAKPVPRGKGYNNKATGVVYSHPRSQVPKWKLDRMRKYKNEVWQTVLISKSNRLAGSNNTLQLTRYPVKLPECLDSEKTMTVMFEPFCSHFSGIHSTMFRKVNSAGTDLDHDTTKRFDVIQNKAGTERHDLDRLRQIDGSGATQIWYKNGYAAVPASTVANAANFTQVKAHLDQIVKQVSVDLVFTASRAFPVVCSVSVVRRIQPGIQFNLTTDDKRELCNSVSNKGIDFKMWRCEWEHTFTLPGLKVGKKIPSKSIKKILKTNFAQTNSFNENTVAGDMADASATALGSNVSGSHNEIADGAASGQFLILIKYRKKQQVQQFTYTANIDMNRSDHAGGTAPVASITLPVVSEESFDIPIHDGDGTGAGSPETGGTVTGAPLTTNQGDESKASMYVHGKLKTCWGFQLETEQLPSVTDGTNKRMQSLMIDPTFDPTNTTYGLYQASPDHVDTS